MPTDVSDSPAPTPLVVRIAGVLVGLQGLAGLVYVVAIAIGGGAQSRTNQLAEAVFFAVMAIAVVAVGVGLLRGMRWARTPAVVIQLLLFGVGWYALKGASSPQIGVPVGIYCALVVVLLFLRPSRAWAYSEYEEE